MSAPWTRVIAHVDMDAFFAAVEQLKNPDLRGKPVIIGADPRQGKGRGVVSTASYEARVYGVHSAMPITRAWKLCPHGIYLKPDGAAYSAYSKQVFAILESFTDRIQPVSIDEAFMDLSGSRHLYPSVEAMGRAIKDRIHGETGLTASVGMAPTKSVAKIASDIDKPDGLTLVPPDAVQEFLDPLPVGRIWGVGEKSRAALSRIGVETVRQLRALDLAFLEERFGKGGAHLYHMARGIDPREVHGSDPIKSVSHETTFGVDQGDEEVLHSTLLWLAEKVSIRLRKHGFRGKTVTLKVRLEDFSTFTRSKTLREPIHLTEDIYAVALELFGAFNRRGKPVRLLGVGLSHLMAEAGRQTTLWDESRERKERLESIMDQLQTKYGRAALTHAQTLARKRREPDTDTPSE